MEDKDRFHPDNIAEACSQEEQELVMQLAEATRLQYYQAALFMSVFMDPKNKHPSKPIEPAYRLRFWCRAYQRKLVEYLQEKDEYHQASGVVSMNRPKSIATKYEYLPNANFFALQIAAAAEVLNAKQIYRPDDVKKLAPVRWENHPKLYRKLTAIAPRAAVYVPWQSNQRNGM